MKFIIHTDGGARGNPGPAAVGVVIERVIFERDPSKDSGRASKTEEIARFGKRIGETTNNVAEYMGIIEALRFAKNNPIIPASPAGRQSTNNPCFAGRQAIIQFFLDSTLVVNQLNGVFKIKDAKLRELLRQVRIFEQEVGGVIRYQSIPREQNTRADFLVNQALDGR